jgi:hypothetical protein
VKGQGAAGVIGQITGQGAVLPGQITGQGANVQGSITGQGAIVPGMSSGQGAISSRGTVHGQGDAKNAGMPVGKNSFPEKTQVDGKRHEQMEHGGGDEVDMADLSKDIFLVDEKFPPGKLLQCEGRKAGDERKSRKGNGECAGQWQEEGVWF